jgi:glucose/arabinose dehydrogenase
VVLAALALVTAGCGDNGRRTGARRGKTTTTSSAPGETTTSLAVVVDSTGTTAGGGSSVGRLPRSTTSTGRGPDSTRPGVGSTTASTGPPNLAAARVKATRVASMSEPVAMAWRTGDANAYVAEKGGRVRSLSGQLALDISGDVSTGAEQGLLGLAFSPDGTKLYIDYTDTAGDTRVVEYGFSAGRAATASRRQLLFVDQPFANHNGGQVVVTKDGRLWIGLGDGGSAGDPADNAQNMNSLLGKLLRIDPRPSGGQPYTVPSDNPFVGRPGARAEIWALGLRNPWRFTFDRATGDLWIGDVGQSNWEEVDFRGVASRGGENYGWSRVEGKHPFKGVAPPSAVGPVYEYATRTGCAVTGGYVYRGSKNAALHGLYVFADYCNGDVIALQRNGTGASVRTLGAKVENLTSFGQDPSGELYALSLNGGVFRLDTA